MRLPLWQPTRNLVGMKPKLKICGITRLDDARFCAAEGVDYLGFVFFEDSPRCIEPGEVGEIVAWVHGPRTVGVFVDENPERINAIVEMAGLDMVQLHGRESPEDCVAVHAPVIKSIPVSIMTGVSDVEAAVKRYRDFADYIMLDTAIGNAHGGTGKVFDWSVATGVASKQETFLAGGLNANNLAVAARTVRPFALDVSSGVERSPGVKDFDLLSELFDAWRSLELTS